MMTKNLLLSFAAWGLLSLGPLSLYGQKPVVEPGVSATLARQRKAAIEDVQYNLKYKSADGLTHNPIGSNLINLDYKGGCEPFLLLDFAGDSVLSIIVNEKPCPIDFQSEHIIIPSDLLLTGHNVISIDFIPSTKALNVNKDFLYSLFVPANARTAFPCFDQPDLRAKFSLQLELPRGYKQIASNQGVSLPTYLFSWVAGDFHEEHCGDIAVLHRQSDSLKVAQIPEICSIASQATNWLEDYTDISYPFERYGMAILPGYQFGGMEHPGAIQFRAETMFLEPNPTPEEVLARYELIAHETAHMWFGDLVTMRWFDDVWTKEVFANFMASKMAEKAFPGIDHNLNFIRSHHTFAQATDRTDGTHPIAQALENLNQAGLLYGNIIYHKAPIMMRMLERRMGQEKLREGLRAYLKKFAWSNSSWDELVEILDSVAPEADAKGFSQAWVKEPGMPIVFTSVEDGKIVVRQEDPSGQGILWPQSFTIAIAGDSILELPIDLTGEYAEISLPCDVKAILPNSQGDGYGYFSIKGHPNYLKYWTELCPAGRYGAILNMTEAWIRGDLKPDEFAHTLLTHLPAEQNPLIASACADALGALAGQGELDEGALWRALALDVAPSVKQRLLRHLYSQAVGQESALRLYNIWRDQTEPLLSQRDYMAMAYRLAILSPEKASEILSTERERLSYSEDLVREFDFVSRACNPDEEAQEELFLSLLCAENRRPEPWTAKMLSLLCDPSREPHCCAYLLPALDALPDIQATGDIFFPSQWLKALLSSLRSPEARSIVADYCAHLPQPYTPLTLKLLEASYLLRRQ